MSTKHRSNFFFSFSQYTVQLQILSSRVADGDIAAFEEAITLLRPLILKVCRTFLESWYDLEDVCQLVFCRLWRDRRKIRSLKAWACRVARNAACDRLRARRRLVLACDLDTELDKEGRLRSESCMPCDECRARLFREIGALPSRQRSAVERFLGRERHFCSADRANLCRGLKSLKRRLAGSCCSVEI